MSSADARGPTERPRLVDRVAAEVYRFDIPALVALLEHLGYQRNEIRYRSHPSLTRPAQLIHALEIYDIPRQAVVVVNIGLLSTQTPLPSFILKAVEEDYQDTLTRFFNFLDDGLLRNRFSALQPETDSAILPNWDRTKLDLLRLLRLKSPATLHWLVALIFPELRVVVERATRSKEISAEPVRLGVSVLGHNCSLGGRASVPIGGVTITLYSQDAFSPAGLLWAHEARRRVREQLLPLLVESNVALHLSLLVRERPPPAGLAANHYLGYDVLAGGTWEAERLVLLDGNKDARDYLREEPGSR